MQVYTYVKCTLLFRQRLLLYYNTFSRLSTELHMKHLPVSVFFLFLIYLHRVRVLRTFVCIFMKKFFIKNSLCFSIPVYSVYFPVYDVYLHIIFLFFFLSPMYVSIVFLKKKEEFLVQKILLFYTFFIFCSFHFVAQSLRFCKTAPYMPRHPLTPLQWQAAGCTSPHDRCGRVLRS